MLSHHAFRHSVFIKAYIYIYDRTNYLNQVSFRITFKKIPIEKFYFREVDTNEGTFSTAQPLLTESYWVISH
jgi:hypothetical protein